jgi:carbamoyltransferase
MGDDEEEYEYDYGSDQDSHYDYGSDQGDIDKGVGEEAGSSSGGGNLNDQWIEIEDQIYAEDSELHGIEVGIGAEAIQRLLREINLDEVEYIGFYDKPFLKFERLLETYLAEVPKGFRSFAMAIPTWLKEKLFLKDTLIKEFSKILIDQNTTKAEIKKIKSKIENKLLFGEHHGSHAGSCFYPSPFEESAILTMDGVGEWTTTAIAHGKNNKIEFLQEIHFPHSLGLLYSAITYFTGFKVNSGEYKVMGLAPYGEAKYVDLIKENLIDIKEDGSFRLNMKYFNYTTGLNMTNKNFNKLFGKS